MFYMLLRLNGLACASDGIDSFTEKKKSAPFDVNYNKAHTTHMFFRSTSYQLLLCFYTS